MSGNPSAAKPLSASMVLSHSCWGRINARARARACLARHGMGLIGFTSGPLHSRAPIQIGEGVWLGADPALKRRICRWVGEGRHRRLHQVRLSGWKRPCASLDLPEEINQRLHGLDTGILPVAIGKLARQRLGDAGRGGDSRPAVRPRFFQVSLQKIEGGFHAPGV